MSYTYSFFDNQTVGAYDLNNITKLFVTKGIEEPFKDGVPYSIEKLNDIVYSKGGVGVVPDSNDTLKVTVSDGVVTINTGTAFFEDGTLITITEPEKLDIEGEGMHYVYLKSSVEENKAYPVISTTPPSGNFVELAEISETGEVSDKRLYAKGKVPNMYSSDAGIGLVTPVYNVNFDTSEIVFSSVPNNYNYFFIRCEGGGKVGTNNGTVVWESYIFINKVNPEQSLFVEWTSDRYISRVNIDADFYIQREDFGYYSFPPTVYGKLITEDGIKLKISHNGLDTNYKAGYYDWVLPFKVQLWAF